MPAETTASGPSRPALREPLWLRASLIGGALTFLAVFILFLGGGTALRGFAFLLVVGLISGTYSTIFIANPVVLWMLNRGAAPPQTQPQPVPPKPQSPPSTAVPAKTAT